MTKLANACPKPRKRKKKAPKPIQRSAPKKSARAWIRRSSKKKAAADAQSGRKVYSTISPAARTAVAKQNAKRRKKEFARAYGSTERVAWTKAQPCIACAAKQQIEVAHTVTGGMGRKANASTTVPLCSWCHAELHRGGVRSFEQKFNLNLQVSAAENEMRWQEFKGAT